MLPEKPLQLIQEWEQNITVPALVFDGTNLTYESRHELPIPPDNDSRFEPLEVIKAAVCLSDLLIPASKHPHGNPPFVLGHEGVFRRKNGDLVVARTTFNSCEIEHGQFTHPLCQEEDDAYLCPDKVVFGIGRENNSPNGTFASNIVVPKASIIRVPEELYTHLLEEEALRRLAQAEPAAVAATALMKAGLKPGQRVFVDGATGNIGALAALAAKSMGTSWVGGTCTSRGEKTGRRDLLLELGINDIYPTSSDFTLPDIDVYVDATPAGAPNLERLLEGGCLAKGSTIVFVGIPSPEQIIAFNLQDLVFNGRKVRGAISSTRQAWEWTVKEFLPNIPVDRLITATFPLQNFEEAFATAQEKGGKVLLDPAV